MLQQLYRAEYRKGAEKPRYGLKELGQSVHVEAYLDVRETPLCIWNTTI
jgi:hypothetical protein